MGKALIAIGIAAAAVVVAVVISLALDDDEGGEPAALTLVGPVWEWEALLGGDGSTIAPDDPGDYTVEFRDDGTVAVEADCIAGEGTYTEEGGSVLIDVAELQEARCADGSLAERYLRDLGFVRTYLIQDGRLYFDLMADAGSLRHRPA